MKPNTEKTTRSLDFLKEQLDFHVSALCGLEDITDAATLRLYKKIEELASEFDLLFGNIDELRTYHLDKIKEIFIKTY